MKTSDPNFKISIPKPCHEDWNKFTPDEKGAFCKVCSKSVHDFTKKSTEEIKTILIQEMDAGNKVCGRFNEDQVVVPEQKTDTIIVDDGALSPLNLNFKKLKRFALALFLVFGGTLFTTEHVSAQKRMGKVAYIPKPEPMKGEVAPVYDDTIVTKIDTTKTPAPKTVIQKTDNKVKGNIKVEPVKGDTVVEKVVPEEIIPEEVLGQALIIDEPILMGDTVVDQTDIEEPPMLMGVVALPICGGVRFDEDDTIDPVPAKEVATDSLMVIDGEFDDKYLTNEAEQDIPTEFDGRFSVPESTDVDIINITGEQDAVQEKDIAPGSTILSVMGAEPDAINMVCFPNPSNGIINLKYSLKRNDVTGIDLYDISGKLVKTLVRSQNMYASDYNTSFDISDFDNGVYFCELRSGEKRCTQKIILDK